MIQRLSIVAALTLRLGINIYDDLTAEYKTASFEDLYNLTRVTTYEFAGSIERWKTKDQRRSTVEMIKLIYDKIYC